MSEINFSRLRSLTTQQITRALRRDGFEFGYADRKPSAILSPGWQTGYCVVSRLRSNFFNPNFEEYDTSSSPVDLG